MSKGSWIKLSALKPGCSSEIMFGCTEFAAERDWLYPDRVMKTGAAIIWVPSKKAHVCVASYIDAFKNGDSAAIERLHGLGIPAGVNFGYRPDDDLSVMYKKDSPGKKRGRKPGSGPIQKVMRAQFASTFEDGTKFKKGDVVKIVFRNKFVGESRTGAKRFENSYIRPTDEELRGFLDSEKKVS